MLRMTWAALALVLAFTVPAAADPTGGLLTAGVVSFLGVFGTPILAGEILAQFIVPGLVLGGLIGANLLLTPKPGGSGPIDPGAMKETFESSDSPEIRLIGRGRVGGNKVFGSTLDTDRFRLIAHCKGEIDAVEGYFLAGREVIVSDLDGAVTSQPWQRTDDASLSWVYLNSKVGDGTETAWAVLTAAFPSLWTTDHRVRGIAQTLAKFISPGFASELFAKLYQQGPPDLEVVLRGEKLVYDPRTGATAWTENGICNALHILRSYPELNDLSLYDEAFIASEADRADVLTLRHSGSLTKRARAWGFWSSEATRGDTMQQVLDSIGAMIVPRAGAIVGGIQQVKLGIQLMDDAPVAEVSIAARNIQKIDYQCGPQGVERPNLCRVKYYCPERNYELAEIDLTGIEWARVESEIAAYGEKPYDVDLPFCPDSGQAQQIARRKFALARADTIVVTVNMSGLAAWGCRFANIEFPDDVGTFLCLIGTPRFNDQDKTVEIPAAIWPDLPEWDPEIDEASAPDQLPEFQADGVLTQPSIPTGAYATSGGGVVTLLGVTYAIPGDGAEVEAVYRAYNAAGEPDRWRAMDEVSGSAGTSGAAEASVNLTGGPVDFRFRTYDPANGHGSYWSPVLSMPNVLLL